MCIFCFSKNFCTWVLWPVTVEKYPISFPNSTFERELSDNCLAFQVLATEKEYIRLSVQAFSAVDLALLTVHLEISR